MNVLEWLITSSVMTLGEALYQNHMVILDS